MNLIVRIPDNVAEEYNKPTLIEWDANTFGTEDELKDPNFIVTKMTDQFGIPGDVFNKHTLAKVNDCIIFSDRITQ